MTLWKKRIITDGRVSLTAGLKSIRLEKRQAILSSTHDINPNANFSENQTRWGAKSHFKYKKKLKVKCLLNGGRVEKSVA